MRRVAILYNEPVLPQDHPDYASEAGVLESVEAFAAALGKANYEVMLLGIGPSLARLVDRLTYERPDVVVNFCEGFAGHSAGEAHVTGLLELLGLLYTGSSPECLTLVRNKVRAKQVLIGVGIPTADYWVVPHEADLELLPFAHKLREQLSAGKLFVKPAAEDASLGIDERSVVADWCGLTVKVSDVQNRYGDALIERYLDGREFNVGVIGFGEPRTLPIAEIEFDNGSEFTMPIVTYSGKWRDQSAAFRGTPVRCPAQVDDALAVRLREVALAAVAATGCRDYARVDCRVTANGCVNVLEVNANPDLGPSAGFARALAAEGMTYDEFVLRLVEVALERGSCHVAANHTTRLPCGELRGLVQAPLAPCDLLIRPFVTGDKSRLLEILDACQMFRRDEIEVADEILRDTTGENDDYRVLVAEVAGQPIGWSCHGRVPLTDATYDLYWIAVHPEHQRRHVGRILLAEIERELSQATARWLLAETSSIPQYEKTRAFYEKTGFAIVGDVADFYRPGDGRVTYGKRMQ
jgi:D-alanine-D-alanine ligase